MLARHLAKVVESSDDAIVSKDLDGVITSWNKAAERLFGYAPAEAIGQSIRMIIPDERQGEEDFVLSHIRSGQAVSNLETIRKRKDGSLVPISLTVSPILDDAGTVIGASKIARDISDRQRGHQAAERLAALVEFSDDAIATKNLDSIITSWNPAAERMFGYTAAEAIGKSIRMIIPPDLQAEEDLVLAKIRAGERVDHYQTVRQRKDGTRVHVSLTVSPLRNAQGEIIGASKIARDITAEQALREETEAHVAITEKLAEVGATVASSLEREVVVQKVTDVARELTTAEFGAFFYNVVDAQSGESYVLYTISGVPREAFAGFPMPRNTAVFAPTFHGDGPVRMGDVTKDPRYGKSAPHFGMPKGHLPVRSYLAVPVTGVNGVVLGGLFFGHSQADVFTEQHERLATGIATWAAVALENSRLYDEARNANRMKDEFLAVLSHELRTPLNAIVGYSRLLRGRVLTGEKAERGLETVERNAQSLTQIVEDVLDVSRIVSGKIRLDVQPVELPLIVDNAVATMQPAADAKAIRMQTMVDPRVGPVSGDPDRLQQVVWNLLSNAVKFTPKAGRVQLRVERVNSHIELVVSDTGLGISPEFLPYVFDRFRQADAGTTRKTGGLGLGLAIVRHIVELHGGTVEATSPGVGQGSTFRVRLPLMIVHPERPPQSPRQHPRTERVAPLTELGDLHGVHVMAVDDDADALSLLEVALESAGASVTTTKAPRDLVAMIEREQPDAVVVDLGMPDIDGFEVIRQIRESPVEAVRNTPAAALTAFARSEDRTRAMRSGFEMHLSKPIDPAELVASVLTLVRRGKR